MELIDTHCHLYSEEFEEDRDAMIERAQSAGVQQFYLPAIDSTAIESMLTLEAKYPGVCIPMMGLHPCYVKENFRKELKIVEAWLAKRPFVAVGEIGLDLYWDKSYYAEQQEAFAIQMQWALDLKIPIVIHSREAMIQTIEMVKPFADKGLRGIFHCFTGTAEHADEITAMGFYLGIGGVVTYKNGGLRTALEQIGLEHLVLETDAPYLAPVPYRGKRNESSYLTHIAQQLADMKQVTLAELAAITTANAQKIFASSH